MKRLLIILLTVCVFTASFTFNAAAAENTITTEKIELLQKLNLIDFDAQSIPESTFTRGDMARLACTLFRIEPMQFTAVEAMYYDMTSEHKYASYIKSAVSTNLMGAFEDGYFRPDSAASFNDLAKLMVKAAGYETYANVTSYASVLSRLNLTKGLNALSEVLTRQEAAIMTYNLLHATALRQTSFGNVAEYETNGDYTVIEYLFGIKYDRGVLDGINGTTLTHPNDTLLEGRITIDGEYYKNAQAKDEWLGMKVKYYYQEDASDEPSIFFISPEGEKNTELVILHTQIENVANGKIEYYKKAKDDKTKTIKIDADMDVCYNGVAYPSYSLSDFDVRFGDIRFLDNNGDGKYDAAFINSYDFILIGFTDAENGIVYDKSIDKSVDFGSDDYITKITKDGEEIAYSKLKVNQLLALRESKNVNGKKKLTAAVSTLSLSGEISELSEDDIVVGKQLFTIDKRLFDTNGADLTIGRKAKFYFWDGAVVRIEANETAQGVLAYLVGAKTSSDDEDVVILRLIEKTAIITSYETAKNVRIDGVKCEEAHDIYTALQRGANASNYSADRPITQPVRFDVNTQGKITKIDTAYYDSTKEKEDSLISGFSGIKKAKFYLANRSFYENEQLVATVLSSAKVFWVPNNMRGEEDYYAVTPNGFADESNYNIEVFYQKDSMIADVVYVYLDVATSVSAKGNAYLLSDIREVWRDGEVRTQVMLKDNTSKVLTYLLSENLSAPALKVGDLVSFRINYAKEITALSVAFDPLAPPDEISRITLFSGETTPPYQAGWRGVYGTVLYRDSNVITLTTSVDTDDGGIENMANLDNYLVSDETKIYIYRKNGSRPAKIEEGNFMSLVPYSASEGNASNVYIFTRDGIITLVYIVEREA